MSNVARQDQGKLESTQVFTPDALATELASWATWPSAERVRVVDLGAGIGALSEAIVGRLAGLRGPCQIDMVEIDPLLAEHLAHDAPDWAAGAQVTYNVVNGDLLEVWPTLLAAGRYSHVILNPPYGRVVAGSKTQESLRRGGIAVSNLYGAFLWIGANLLADHGEMLAIVPRSFCNGPSFKALRAHLLRQVAVTRIHHFTSRREVFHRDRVQQEVLLLKFTKRPEGLESDVLMSASHSLKDLGMQPVATSVDEVIINEPGGDVIIRIPAIGAPLPLRSQQSFLMLGPGEAASTGSVVDFRVAELTEDDGPERVPLIEAHDLTPSKVLKRPRRFLPRRENLQKHVFPPGDYVVIARFSPREQRPRIRARILSQEETTKYGGVAFENHVNVIHREKRGLGRRRAAEIMRQLSSEDVDRQISSVSGTTQINIADLRRLTVSNRPTLRATE